jgi:hypothetical protein
MGGRGGRFGKYGELKRKTKLRQARLSHLERSQPGPSSDQRPGGKRRKAREER